MQEFNADFIETALKNEVWDLGNSVLYDLCTKHPHHKTDDEIIAKVWLIGRAYSAAIERRREQGEFSGDDFYTEKVVSEFHKANVDVWLNRLRLRAESNCKNLPVEIHGLFCKLMSRISNQNKRSLSSKYLHFHFPDKFYIYDARALMALRHLLKQLGRYQHLKLQIGDNADREYAAFYTRCYDLQAHIRNELGLLSLRPRNLDKVLLAWYAAHPCLWPRPKRA